VVVPCFNESARLRPAALEPLACEPRVRLLFVDDGSTDGTSALLEDLARRWDSASVVTLPTNLGKGEAVRLGLLHGLATGAEIVGYLDADLATPAPELLRLLDILDGSHDLDVVLGARVALLGHDIVRSPFRHYTGRVFATAAAIALGVPVYDTQCGAKLFRATPQLTSALATGFRSRWAFDVELLFRLLHADDDAASLGRIREEPLLAWHDTAGSKVRLRHAVPAFAVVGRLAMRRFALRAANGRRRRGRGMGGHRSA
jgi:dolichyl-phosphate beta-glucosyltransferase